MYGNYAEVYLNPASTSTCPDNAGDTLQANSCGTSDKHSNEERYTHHKTCSSALLHQGANTLMFCARNASGGINPPLDAYLVYDVVLHYQTN